MTKKSDRRIIREAIAEAYGRYPAKRKQILKVRRAQKRQEKNA